MKIVDVRHWMVRVPFGEDMLWASGRRDGVTRLVVRIKTDGGVVGWGETICLIEPVRAVFEKVVAPLALGYEVSQAERFVRHVLGAGYYHHKRAAVMACAGLEMAMWDALGKQAGLPLHQLWGGQWRSSVAACAYLFAPSPKAIAEKAKRFLDWGYTTFKAKIGFGIQEDVRIIEALKPVTGDCDLRADVNGAWSVGTARRCLKALGDFDLAYVEQPLQLDDLPGHAALRQAQMTPIALDESAYTLEDVMAIIRAEAADMVLLDPHEAGGCWQTIKAAGACEGVGIAVTLHSGAELALSQAAYVHLAGAIPNLMLAIDTERAYLADDISDAPPVLADGRFALPEGPGLGVIVNEEALERYAVSEIRGAYLDRERPGWFPTKPSF